MKMKYWAIYLINIGDQYDPEMVMQTIADESLEKLAARIPADSQDVYVVSSEPVKYSLKFVPTLS